VRLVRFNAFRAGNRHGERGQAIVEFSLVFGLIMLPLVLAIADFGRVYTGLVAVESAAREAADYGAFKSSFWDASAGNPAITTAEMQRRACTAAFGSHLEDYSEPSGQAVAHSTCTNPSFTCQIEPPGGSGELAQACASYSGTYCSTSTSEPPCGVHVTLAYTFNSILGIGPLHGSFSFSRDSIYRVSDLPVPTAAPSASP
jgi:Flp pilus assembly protein TadG